MSNDRSLRRWRVACAVLAAVTIYTWSHRDPVATSRAAPGATRAKSRATPGGGLSERDLIAKLVAARGAGEMRALADQLAPIAGDEIVAPLRPLIGDLRPGVSDVVIELYGRVGSERAVSALLELAHDRRDVIEQGAVTALGHTHDERAELFLIGELATQSMIAADALATMGSDTAVAALATAAEGSTDDFQRSVFAAIGRVETPAKQRALRELMDSPSIATATLAIETISDVDDETLGKLAAIVTGDDPALGVAAVTALGRAGDPAAAILVDVARNGVNDLRLEAVRALGSIHSDAALDALREIVDADEGDVSTTALQAIARLDTPEAHEVVIEIAMADGTLAATAVDELGVLSGDDIDAALVVIAKSDSPTALAALGYLVKRDNAEALAIVVAKASTGEDDDRFAAMQLLAAAGTEEAFENLVGIVATTHGALKARALDIITQLRPQDVTVVDLLTTALRSSDSEEAMAAARALGRVGSEEARSALLGALSSSDHDVVVTALAALDGYRIDATSESALVRVAETNPELRSDVMRKLLAAGSQQGVELARRGLRGDPQIAYETIQSIRSSGAKQTFDLLSEAVRVTQGETRGYALDALAGTRDPRAVDVVVGALRDTDYNVRGTAASALRAIGGKRANEALLQLSHSGDPSDRIVALRNFDSTDPSSSRRIVEIVRTDANESVREYAMYSLVNDANGIAALRSLALDRSASTTSRSQAASVLVQYGLADEAVSAVYDTLTED